MNVAKTRVIENHFEISFYLVHGPKKKLVSTTAAWTVRCMCLWLIRSAYPIADELKMDTGRFVSFVSGHNFSMNFGQNKPSLHYQRHNRTGQLSGASIQELIFTHLEDWLHMWDLMFPQSSLAEDLQSIQFFFFLVNQSIQLNSWKLASQNIRRQIS